MFVFVDTTRTVHFGEPTVFQKEAFTRVLKGFISMGSATFPVKAPVSIITSNLQSKLYSYCIVAVLLWMKHRLFRISYNSGNNNVPSTGALLN